MAAWLGPAAAAAAGAWDDRRGPGGGWGYRGGYDAASADRLFQHGLLKGLTRSEIEGLKANKHSDSMKQAIREVLRETGACPEAGAAPGVSAFRAVATPHW